MLHQLWNNVRVMCEQATQTETTNYLIIKRKKNIKWRAWNGMEVSDFFFHLSVRSDDWTIDIQWIWFIWRWTSFFHISLHLTNLSKSITCNNYNLQQPQASGHPMVVAYAMHKMQNQLQYYELFIDSNGQWMSSKNTPIQMVASDSCNTLF